MQKNIIILISLIISYTSFADDGSRLWLKYDLIKDINKRNEYIKNTKFVAVNTETPTLKKAAEELSMGINGLLNKQPLTIKNVTNQTGGIVLDVSQNNSLTNDGFAIFIRNGNIVINSNSDVGVLYGVFELLRKIQTGQSLNKISVESSPKIKIRMLNHWDNANGTVERGYAGSSIWKWNELPFRVDPRYIQYARVNASLGINATSINNVNASSRFLTAEYLEKIKAVADVLRPYGIKVFISVNFRSPRTLGGLKTSDPLDPEVRKWWNEKTKEIHQYIPDFGGYLVKANSEGEPGPQDYGRTHADGANMLAEAMKPFSGIVVWRAFVYNADPNGDRFKEAYEQFKPLDGKFESNVIVQVKNGPIDFMPREPFHPMFGAFQNTPLAMEFQITQEYLGQSTHLTYLAPMFKECLDTDIFAKGKGSTVAKVVDGSLYNSKNSLIAGVANTGSDANWCGHPFNQANWYAFGRLAWNNELSSEQIAKEWIGMTLTNDAKAKSDINEMMQQSLPTYISYTYPLGLHHMMGESHHYGPEPWLSKSGRPDWTSIYYHRADSIGLGFDRTGKLSNALKLYSKEINDSWGNAEKCDLNYLMWFHHVAWSKKLSTGNSLWDELCLRYYDGPKQVKGFQEKWASLEKHIDPETFRSVGGRLKIQEKEAIWWRDACVLYFQEYSKMPLPKGLMPPTRTLDEVKKLVENLSFKMTNLSNTTDNLHEIQNHVSHQTAFSLEGKLILITGGGSGIGFEIAQCMAYAGAKIIITGRREDVLKESAKQLGDKAIYFVNDVTELNSLENLVNEIELTYGPIDILVNNAGVNMKRPALEVSDDDFNRIIQTNLNAVFALTRTCAARMIARKSGSIIMISSMAAYYGIDRVVAYAASKSGLEGMVKVLASEFSPFNVRVNAIAPGFIETNMMKTAMGSDPDRMNRALRRTPMGKFGKPSDIGWAAVFLASDAARYITGVSLPVDGGNSIGF